MQILSRKQNNLCEKHVFYGALVHSCGMSSSIETQMERSFPLTRGEKKKVQLHEQSSGAGSTNTLCFSEQP